MGRLFVIIGGLLVLVLTLALVVPPFINWTGYRNSFEQEASRILGRPVHVNGTATARLLPFPSVTFSDVVVEGANGGNALTMDQFSMDAELMPFLRGEILIFDMRMEKPHLFTGLDAQGQLDWALPENSEITGSKVRLEKLTLNDGKITLYDKLRNRQQQFDHINATLSADSLAGPWRAKGRMLMDGEPYHVEMNTSEKKADNPLYLRVRLQPDDLAVSMETEGDVRIEDGKPLYQGRFSFLTLSDDQRQPQKNGQAQQPTVTLDKLRLTGKFTAQNSGFDIAEFRMEQGEADAPYVINGQAQLDLSDNPHFSISADGQQVYLDGMQPDTGTKSASSQDAVPVLSLREKMAFLQSLLERIPVPDIPGNIDLRLPAIIASGTTIRSVIIRAQPDHEAWNISQLQADLPGRTQIEASGKLHLGQSFGFDGRFLLASRQPAGFASWLSGEAGYAVAGQIPAAGFSGRINLNNDVQRVDDLEIVLGDTVLKGSFERNSGFNRAASSVLNIEGEALDAGTMKLLSRVFLNKGDLSALAGENLTVMLKAGPVRFAGLEAEKLDTAFRLSDGKLDFDRLLISGLEGATISATGALNPFDHSVNATLDATVLADDLRPLLNGLNGAFPREALISALAMRANNYPDLFTGAKLDLLVNAVNLFGNGETTAGAGEKADKNKINADEKSRGSRVKPQDTTVLPVTDGVAELSFSLNGQTGALILAVAGSSKGTLTGAEPMQISMTANAKAASGEAALALLGMPVLPLGLMGEAEINLQAQGAPVAGMKTSLEISGDDGRARLDGVITLTGNDLTASGKAALQSDDLEPFLVTTGYTLPFGSGFGAGLPVNITSDFQYGKNIVRLPNLQGKLDDEAVSAKIEGSLGEQSVAQLRGEMQLERLDLPALFAAMAGLGASDIGHTTKGGWSETAFEDKTNLPLGLDIKVRAAQAMITPNDTIGDFSARLVKTGQVLQLSELGGSWAKGKLSGKFELNNANGTVLANGDLRLSGAVMEDVYLPEAMQPPLHGTGDVKLNFTGSGQSMAGLVHSLAGEGSATLQNVEIAGLNIPAVNEILRRSDTLPDGALSQADIKKAEAERLKLAQTLTQTGHMSAAEVQTALSLAGGVIRAPVVKVENDKASLQADLQLDLNHMVWGGNGVLDLVLPAYERNDAAPQIRMKISGGWQQPQVQFDYQPMVQFLTRRGLLREQQRVEASQALIIEKQRLKREADYYASLKEARKRARLEAEEAERKRAEEAERVRKAAEDAKAAIQNALPDTGVVPDFKPSLDEFLQTLPNAP